MKPFGESDDPRRRLLIQALAAGAFSAALPLRDATAQLLGSVPGKLPPGKSIYRLSGDVKINGRPATVDTAVGPTDTVETAANGEIIFVVGASSYLVRGGSRLVLEQRHEGNLLTSALRLLTGRLLAVFGGAHHSMSTAAATIGIRGTGVYVESDPEQTYFCTCYGVTDVAAANDPSSRDTVVSQHHNRPLYILAKAPSGKSIRNAPFINHTDQELMLIESLVGRTPPFVFPGDAYSAPRRDY